MRQHHVHGKRVVGVNQYRQLAVDVAVVGSHTGRIQLPSSTQQGAGVSVVTLLGGLVRQREGDVTARTLARKDAKPGSTRKPP